MVITVTKGGLEKVRVVSLAAFSSNRSQAEYILAVQNTAVPLRTQRAISLAV